jgi:hypothetical protein
MCRQTDLAGAHVASRLGPLVRSGKPGRVGAHHGRVEERRAQAFAVDAVVLNVALWIIKFCRVALALELIIPCPNFGSIIVVWRFEAHKRRHGEMHDYRDWETGVGGGVGEGGKKRSA